MPKSFAPQVIADSSGKFVGNALRFATREEAQANADNLAQRWFLVTATRVVESEDPVNYQWLDAGNVLVPVKPTLTTADTVITQLDLTILRDVFKRMGSNHTGNDIQRDSKADQLDYLFMRDKAFHQPIKRIFGRWETVVNNESNATRGYFENIHNGNGGMLTFEGRRLVDYDGVYELPVAVMTALADLGYVLDWTMLDLPAPASV